jgi:Kef-type K+ transport system membrane component KefB
MGPGGATLLTAAGGEEALPELVLDIGLALVGAGMLAVLFTRLRIPTVAAFLLAGVLLGPVGTGLINNPDNIDTISQLGLVLLLFLIGLEIDARGLLARGRTVVVSGLAQYPLTAVLGFLVAQGLILAGVTVAGLDSQYAALYVGLSIAASSTLLVVALFQQTFTLDTQPGRISLALLVFQDVWAIIVLALQPNLDDPQLVPIASALLGIVLVGVIAYAIAQTILPIGFTWIARQPGTILVASLAWCFAVVLIGINLDAATDIVGLVTELNVSAGMAGLIAGATIASLPFSSEIIRQVSVVRDFFVTLFFVGLGMTIPAPEGPGILVMAAALAALAVASRYVVMLPLFYVSGLDRRTATLTSTKLAQMSEFSLVIAFLGLELGHISAELNATIIFAFVITAIATNGLFTNADRVYERMAPLLDRLGLRPPPSGENAEGEDYELALLGVHRTGSSLLHELSESMPELLERTVVVDFNVDIHRKIAEMGPRVFYGDLTSPEILRHAGVDRAGIVLCTIQDDFLASASTVDVVAVVREVNPDAVVLTTGTTFAEQQELYAAGADFVLMPRLASALAARDAIQAALEGRVTELRGDGEGPTGRREVLG